MTRWRAAVLLVMALVLQRGTVPAAQQAGRSGTATVTGRVARADTGAPVEMAMVRLTGPNGSTVQTATSGESGEFKFDRLPAGEYRLTPSVGRGLVSADATPARPMGVGKLIKVADGQQLTRVELALVAMPALEGRVLDPTGAPITNVPVSLVQWRFILDKPVLAGGAINKTTVTDADGKYRFVELPPGDYYVLATGGPFETPGSNPTPVVSDALLSFVPTYFPGTDRMAVARPVRVEIGIDAVNVTFAMVPATLTALSGTVLDPNGKVVSEAGVLLLPTELGVVRGDLAATAKTDNDGKFEFPKIPTGTYVLQAFSRPGFGSRTVTVAVTQDSPARVDVTIRPPITARGRVRFEGGPAPPESTVDVRFSPTDFTSGPAFSNAITTRPRADWTFELSALAWTGVIRVGAPAGWALKSVVLNGRDIADEPWDFQSADVNGLELVMTNRLGTIVGTVTDGNLPAAVLVLLFPDDVGNGSLPSRFLNAASSETDGRFKITGVLAGRYRAVATILPATFEPQWLKDLYPFATPVVVGEDETKTLALKVIRR